MKALRRAATIVLALSALMTASAATFASENESLVALIADSADSRRDHAALAAYYEARAEEERGKAAHERTGRPGIGKLGASSWMQQRSRVRLHEQRARQYNELARMHREHAHEG